MRGSAARTVYLDLKPRDPNAISPEWTVAIFASRESATVLAQSIQALLRAIETYAFVDIIVNGNERLAQEIAEFVGGLRLDLGKSLLLRVWEVAQGDKAHAWNQYLYGIWAGAELAFFVDGYVRVQRHAFTRIADAMRDDRHALAATGVPSQGRSAAKLRAQIIAENGIHGNLYSIRGMTLEALRREVFILPLGIYRTDALLGAAIKFNLDPVRYRWDPQRVRVVPDASWSHTPLSAMRPADWLAQLRRILRQGRGVFENLAIRRHLDIERRSLAMLPETAADLVNNWMESHPGEVWRAIVKRPLAAFSLRSVKRRIDWSKVGIAPRMLAELRSGTLQRSISR